VTDRSLSQSIGTSPSGDLRGNMLLGGFGKQQGGPPWRSTDAHSYSPDREASSRKTPFREEMQCGGRKSIQIKRICGIRGCEQLNGSLGRLSSHNQSCRYCCIFLLGNPSSYQSLFIDYAWRLIVTPRFLPVRLLDNGPLFVLLKFVMCPVMAFLLWQQNYRWEAAFALFWPLANFVID
jgi:hypothetical protein